MKSTADGAIGVLVKAVPIAHYAHFAISWHAYFERHHGGNSLLRVEGEGVPVTAKRLTTTRVIAATKEPALSPESTTTGGGFSSTTLVTSALFSSMAPVLLSTFL